MGATIDSSAWTGRGPNYTGKGLPDWWLRERECARFLVMAEFALARSTPTTPNA